MWEQLFLDFPLLFPFSVLTVFSFQVLSLLVLSLSCNFLPLRQNAFFYPLFALCQFVKSPGGEKRGDRYWGEERMRRESRIVVKT